MPFYIPLDYNFGRSQGATTLPGISDPCFDTTGFCTLR